MIEKPERTHEAVWRRVQLEYEALVATLEASITLAGGVISKEKIAAMPAGELLCTLLTNGIGIGILPRKSREVMFQIEDGNA